MHNRVWMHKEQRFKKIYMLTSDFSKNHEADKQYTQENGIDFVEMKDR